MVLWCWRDLNGNFPGTGKGRKKWDRIKRRDKLISGFWLRNLGVGKWILKVDKGIGKLCCWQEELIRQQICDS